MLCFFLGGWVYIPCFLFQTNEYLHQTMTEGTENVFECAICTEDLTDPRILRCSPTFCRKCLQQLVDKSSSRNSLECPLCREKYILPANGVNGIQKNFYLAGQNRPKRASFSLCKYHIEEDLRFYCYKCKCAICRDCKVLSHYGHKIDLVSNLAAEYRLKVDKLIKETDDLLEYLLKNLCVKIGNGFERSSRTIDIINHIASNCISEISILQERLASELFLNNKHSGLGQASQELTKTMDRLENKKQNLLASRDLRKVDVIFKAFDDLEKEKTRSSHYSTYSTARLADDKDCFAEKEALLMFENFLQTIQSEVKSCNVRR